MKLVLLFTIMGLPKTTNASRGQGHSGSLLGESRKWKKAVWSAETIEGKPSSPLVSARPKLIRYSSADPDFDNLVSSFKWVVDGLIDAGIIISDKPSVIGQPIYKWKKVASKNGFIEVVVTEG